MAGHPSGVVLGALLVRAGGAHRAELDELEEHPASPAALLAEQHRPPVDEAHGGGDGDVDQPLHARARRPPPVTSRTTITSAANPARDKYSVPHAHVEIHRPDGSAINPYWSLVRSQRAAACATNDRLRGAPTPAVNDAIPASAFIAWVSVAAQHSVRTSGADGAIDLRISADGYATTGGEISVGDGRHGGDCDLEDRWFSAAARARARVAATATRVPAPAAAAGAVAAAAGRLDHAPPEPRTLLVDQVV